MTATSAAQRGASVQLMAPLTGVLVPIEQVPDPVFARKMVGEGISIDPLSNILVAPVAGEVIDLQPSAHAITIRSPRGSRCSCTSAWTPSGCRVRASRPRSGLGTRRHGRRRADRRSTWTWSPRRPRACSPRWSSPTPTLVDATSQPATGLRHRRQGRRRRAVRAHGRPRRGAGSRGPAGRTATDEAILVPEPDRPARPAGRDAVRPGQAVRAPTSGCAAATTSANAKSIMAIMGMAVGSRREGGRHRARAGRRRGGRERWRRPIATGLGEDCPPLPVEEAPRREAVDGRRRPRSAEPEPQRRRPGPATGTCCWVSRPRRASGSARVLQMRHEDIDVDEDGRATTTWSGASSTPPSTGRCSTCRPWRSGSEQEADAGQGGHLRRAPGDPGGSRPAGPGGERHRQGQDRAVRVAGAPTTLRRPAGRPGQRGAGRARQRRARRRPAGAGGAHRPASRAAGASPPGTILIAEDLTPSDTAQLDRTQGRRLRHHRRRRVLATWRSSPAPSTSRPSPASSPARWTSPTAPGWSSTAPRAPLRMNVTDDEVERDPSAPGSGSPSRQADELRPQGRARRHHRRSPRRRWSPTSAALEDAERRHDQGRRGRRPAAQRVRLPGPRSRPDRGRAGEDLRRHARGRSSPASRWSSAPWTSAATSRCPTCRSPPRRTRSSAIRGVRVGLEPPEVLRTQCRAILRGGGRRAPSCT